MTDTSPNPDLSVRPRPAVLRCRPAALAALALALLAVSLPDAALAAEDPPGAPAPDRPAAEPGEEGEQGEEGDSAPGRRYKTGVYILDGDYYTSFAENTWRILSGPFHYDTRDWITAGIAITVTGALMLLDDEINDFWQDHVRGDATDSIENVVQNFGDTRNLVLGTLGGYALSEAVGLEREKAMFLNGFQSVVLTGAVIAGIKYLGQRERPDDAKDAFDWNGPGGGKFNTSFPSGHSGGAFAMATVLAETYGEEHSWVPWLVYPAAALTALGRINAERHWASDVVMGAAIGHFIARMVTRYSPFLEENGVELGLFGQDRATGLSLTLRF